MTDPISHRIGNASCLAALIETFCFAGSIVDRLRSAASLRSFLAGPAKPQPHQDRLNATCGARTTGGTRSPPRENRVETFCVPPPSPAFGCACCVEEAGLRREILTPMYSPAVRRKWDRRAD
jgi:hypothetical protein